MTLDINIVVPKDRQLIQFYGEGKFKVSGVDFDSSILVFLEETHAWSATSIEDITLETLKPVIDATDDVDLLLVGCGARFAPVPKGLRQGLKDAGIVMEWMDTGAASRTFNVLVAEERRVAAAILAVP